MNMGAIYSMLVNCQSYVFKGYREAGPRRRVDIHLRHTCVWLKVSFNAPCPGLGWASASEMGKEKNSKQLRVLKLYVLENW